MVKGVICKIIDHKDQERFDSFTAQKKVGKKFVFLLIFKYINFNFSSLLILIILMFVIIYQKVENKIKIFISKPILTHSN